jgi:hypothetical protein
MDERYREVIEWASSMLAAAVEKYEQDLPVVTVDGRVRELLRGVGLRTVEVLYAGQSRRATTAAAGRGLTVQRRPRISVTTLFGVAKMESPYLWNPATGESARPVAELGLRDRGRTLAVERALTDFGAEESFGQASCRFEEHYGFAIGRTTVLRVVESHARRVETYVQQRLSSAARQFDESLASRPGVERMLVEMDGCEIRTGTLNASDTDELTAVRKLPKRVREEAWRDVRVGLARPLEEVTPTYVACMDKYPVVVEQMVGAACARGLSSRTKVVAVADGGNGLREAIDAKFAGVRFILDRPHLQQHLYETADAIGHKGVKREHWIGRQLLRADQGQVDELLDDLGHHKGRGKSRVDNLRDYITRFRDALNYDAAKADGLPIGSGEIESAHRTIPQKRMKLPGAWWSPINVNPMLALRIVRANDWWQDYWQSIAANAELKAAA